MPDEKQRLSAEELDRLIDDLAPAAGSAGADRQELDRTLADILGTAHAPAGPVSAARMARGGPAPAKAAPVQAPPAQKQQPAPAKEVQDAPAQPAPPAQDDAAKPAAKPAPPRAPKKENIPQADRRPFTAGSGLQLDDNPLVSEDFRRFFTTSVTPDALFSSRTDLPAGGRTPARPPQKEQGPVFPLHTRPQPEEEEDEEDETVRQPHPRRGSLWDALRSFFTVEEEPEDDPEDVQEDEDRPLQPTMDDSGNVTPPQPADARPRPVRHDTAVFEPVEHPPVAVDPLHATTVFDPVTDPAAQPTHATTVFEPVTGQTAAAPDGDAAAVETPTKELPVQEIAETLPPQPAEQPAALPVQEIAEQTTLPEGPTLQPVEELAEEPQAQPEAAQPADDGPAAEEPADTVADDPRDWPDDDYYTPAQQPRIAAALRSMVLGLTLRAVGLGLLAAICLYFGVAAAFPTWPQPAGLVGAGSGGMFTLTVLLVSLLLGGVASLPALKGGFAGLLEAPSADSFAALSWAGALLQTLVLLLSAGSFDAAVQVPYAGFALLALFTGALGKRSLAVGVQKNFARLTDGQQKYAVAALMQDAGLVRRLTHGLGEAEPCLLVSRPTDFYEGFLQQSFAARQGDAAARTVCRLLPAAALLAGILGVLLDAGFMQPFAAVLCIGCPLSMVLVSAVPGYFMNRSARAAGTILPGPAALEELGQANVVVTNAGDLFPAGAVTLKGMKVFGEHRIDLAILYAASLLVPQCSTLKDIFMNIIQGRTELLYKVENLTREIGCGLDGWADGRHLLVGNRGMMISHGVQVPPEDYEARYTRDGRYSPVYLAVNGQLGAMFVVGYRPDAEVKELLDEVYVSGLSLLVVSDDFNLTGERIDTVYGIPSGCIKVLGAAESQRLADRTAHCPRATGAMLHSATSLRSYLAGIRIAANAAGMEKAACTLQTASVAVSTLLVLILTCTGGLGALGVAAILLYQLAWLLLTLLLPCAKQY